VEVWKGGQRLGRAGEQAEDQAHHGGANGDGGRRCVLGRAQGMTRRGFYRPGESQEISPKRRAYMNHGMGAKAVGNVRRCSGQWQMAVRPRACARRPRVADLGVGGVSRP
jgi:hypothetical protein